ncbi:hypothetical protein HMPREF9554_01755 [Treponema phagedenis F0421]|nr:hypothetical protein HMPREF9554_01755 [Treponema phagedenis F0421]
MAKQRVNTNASPYGKLLAVAPCRALFIKFFKIYIECGLKTN